MIVVHLFKWLVIVLLALAVVIFVLGQVGMLRGTAPDLGVLQGKLKPPSNTPNSVSSQAQQGDAQIAPLTYKGDAANAMQQLRQIVQASPGITIIASEPTYLYAQCQTRWLKFVDDLEFYVDDANKHIHVRSASRIGRKDFGVNRARVEAIRAQFVQRAP